MEGRNSTNRLDHDPPPEYEETTPLLSGSQAGVSKRHVQREDGVEVGAEVQQEEDDLQSNDIDAPLPRKQIFLLCFARFVEPVVYFSIFPFVQEMVVHVGNVPEAEVGFYSGLIESLFSLTQMILMIPWSRASDGFGRKPVLILSMCGIMVFTTLFGFSQTLWQMILFRCLAGVFAGSIVTIRTMITEHSTSKTQARAFSFFQFSSNIGIFVGPFIGGALADPAHQYPSAFGKVGFFHRFPYALPTIVTGGVCAIAIITTTLFVKETLPKTKDRNSEAGENNQEEPLSIYQLLRSPGVAIVVTLYGLIFLLAFAYTAIIPVFWFTPVKIGGCGFSPLMISIFLAAGGLLQSIYGLLIFPPLQLRIGTKQVLQGCSFGWPVLFMLHTSANYILRAGSPILFWIMACILLMGMSAMSMAFIAAQLAINDSAPSPSAVATLNGIALSVMSGTRAFTPALFTSIFATSVSRQILGGQLAWVTLAMCSLPVIVLARRISHPARGN